MKKLLIIAVASFAFGLSLQSPSAAHSLPVFEKKYANCDELRTIYPGGVAKSSNWVNKGGKIRNKPAVNAKVYLANQGKDRDKDGIACEN